MKFWLPCMPRNALPKQELQGTGNVYPSSKWFPAFLLLDKQLGCLVKGAMCAVIPKALVFTKQYTCVPDND